MNSNVTPPIIPAPKLTPFLFVIWYDRYQSFIIMYVLRALTQQMANLLFKQSRANLVE